MTRITTEELDALRYVCEHMNAKGMGYVGKRVAHLHTLLDKLSAEPEPMPEILGVSMANGHNPFGSWEYVDHIRTMLRRARGLPGLHFPNNWMVQLADEMAAQLPPRDQ